MPFNAKCTVCEYAWVGVFARRRSQIMQITNTTFDYDPFALTRPSQIGITFEGEG